MSLFDSLFSNNPPMRGEEILVSCGISHEDWRGVSRIYAKGKTTNPNSPLPIASGLLILISSASLQRLLVNLRPFRVEDTRLIGTLVGVGAKVITLCLGEVLWQTSTAVAVKVI